MIGGIVLEFDKLVYKDGETIIPASNLNAIQDAILELDNEKVDREELGDAGIKSVEYVPLFGGEFSVVTLESLDYQSPHARASVTGSIDKNYVYKVSIDGMEYKLPYEVYMKEDDGSTKCFAYLGNVGLFVDDGELSGITHEIQNVPVLIVFGYYEDGAVDVFTENPGEYDVEIDREEKVQTDLPKSLIYGKDYYPIEVVDGSGVYGGVSIGANRIENAKGTFAAGYGNVCGGMFGFVVGKENEVGGERSAAIGGGNVVSGTGGIAAGVDNSLTGNAAASIGKMNVNDGSYTFTSGYNNSATAQCARAVGGQTAASASFSCAEAYKTTASGTASHAEGNRTIASGSNSHAEGANTEASGPQAHAEGYMSVASGNTSHAEGSNTVASGVASHAEGFKTIASQRSQHVFGEYNIEDMASDAGEPGRGSEGPGGFAGVNEIREVGEDKDGGLSKGVNGGGVENPVKATSFGRYIEIVGNGTSEENRSNARTLDWSGNEVLAGGLTVGENGITIGQTTITEEQLIGLLALLASR